ncbi:MAG: nitrous oxide reductase family maturation protein NosD [gamma proteobacterium symbiont of Bathyaustriella thionipta]|nr:nitrous oxide reductase family maturation protein NosD [gamma proteobacterium symbiont of Bathyaustriella thionipta]MCU7953182.1 nitrous oxide reductase family maturation protein NosD [gamma proteobacterium symbiont of Bathyaustriella thionipta]MCU7957691.1 nitrous oxide reductase family maturation protein NosD [gamma proteobacterium symbiont of Bathyaustriella thionipta]
MTKILLLLFLSFQPAFCLPPLQLYIAITPPGGVLNLEPGFYSGPAIITRPITINGHGKVTIDAQGEGTVLTIEADKTIIKGLHLTNSGDSFDKTDAGIILRADNALIENNIIENTLFGIHLQGANENTIRNNRITSKDTSLSLRGDGLRMWNSYDNLIENNDFIKVRDIYITNSHSNRFIGNHVSHSRIGFELVFSHENEIIANSIEHNSTGFMVVYSTDLLIKQNHISHLRSFAGFAMAFKESNMIKVVENEILHCATGISANSPLDPENMLTIKNNHFIYNDVALYFYGEKGGHIIHGNHFEANLLDVQASLPRASYFNDWQNNRWDLYEGFDRNNDGVGDTPYSLYSWSDRLWVDVPMTQFFRGTPMLETIDFMERLVSFSEPALMLEDKTPKVQ